MSANNPSITASDIVSEVENLLTSPNISTSVYLPWISYAYQKVYQALANAGQRVREEFFADSATISMNTTSPNEYTITDSAPRFGGLIKVEVKYGASGDEWLRASKIRSIAHWKIQNNVSTTYRGKDSVVYYILGPKIGFIPTPPEAGAQAKLWYVKRPYQITDGEDVIDIPYRFIYPIYTYVQAKAIERENEDYSVARDLMNRFRAELEDIAIAAESELNENDGTQIVEDYGSALIDNPFEY